MSFLRVGHSRVSGQSTLEIALLIGAMGAAVVLMTPYVRQAFNGFAKATERELNGATEENSPFGTVGP